MAYLIVSEVTRTSISLYVAGLDPAWGDAPDNDTRNVEWYYRASGDSHDTYAGTTYLPGSYPNSGYTQGGDITLTGLLPGTAYMISCSIYSPNKGFLTSLYITAITEAGIPRPDNWSWTQSELNAFNNHGLISTLTASRWNAFIDRVNLFAAYKTAPQVGGSYYVSPGEDVTAAKFNQVKYTIDYMKPTGIPTVYPGDTIYGYYFTTLSWALNSIP